MKRVNDHFTYFGCDVFENLVDRLGSLVVGPLRLINFGRVVLQVLVRLGKVLLQFFDTSFGVLNFHLDLLFCLIVANQCFVLTPNDPIKIGQPPLGGSELFFLKLYPMMDQTTYRASMRNTYCVVRRAIWVSNRWRASVTA